MDFIALSQQCAPWVAYETMAAIVKTESGFRPLAIGVNGGARLTRQPDNKAEAVVTAKWLIANGYNIDMGLGQVNSTNLVRTGLTVDDAFDPCKNLTAAATILHANYVAAVRLGGGEQATLHAALSSYNTGSFSRGFANGYVQKVVANAPAARSAQPPTPAGGPQPILLVGAKPAASAVTASALNVPTLAIPPSRPAKLRIAQADEPVRLQVGHDDEPSTAIPGDARALVQDSESVFGGSAPRSVMVY